MAKPVKVHPQPLYKTLERELGFSHGAMLAAAKSVTLFVGDRPAAKDHERDIHLPANGVSVRLSFEPGSPIPEASRISIDALLGSRPSSKGGR